MITKSILLTYKLGKWLIQDDVRTSIKVLSKIPFIKNIKLSIKKTGGK